MPDISQQHLDMMAYKLYIREHATLENLVQKEFWNFPNRSFGIVVKDMDDLIEEALGAGYEFNKQSFKKNHEYGRGIWNHIKYPTLEYLSKEWVSEKHFEDFGQLFKCCSYDDFRGAPEFAATKKKYHDKVRELIESPSHHNFIFYYWNKSHLARALLAFSVSDRNANKPVGCRISYYDEKLHKYEHAEDNPEAVTGDSQHSYVSISGSRAIFLTINAPIEKFTHWEVLFCAYSAIHKSNLPFSGVGILQRTQDPDIDKKMPDEVPPNIYHYLFRKASFVTEEFIDNETELRDMDETHTLGSNEFVGLYRGFYLDNNFKRGEKVLRTLLLDIEPSGKVTIFDGEHGKHGIQDGFYYMDKDTGLMIIDADIDLNSGKEPRYHIIIDARQNNPRNLEGVYGGYSKYLTPFIGLIKLEKLENASIKNVAQEFRPTHFTSDDQRKKNFRERINKEITDFFEDSKFFSYPSDCLLIDPRPAYKGQGQFYFYGVSSFGRGSLVRYYVSIEGGRAYITTKDTKDKPREGRALSFNNGAYVVLDFLTTNNDANEANDPYTGVYLIQSKQMEEGMGVAISLRVNRFFNVQAKLEYIFSSHRHAEMKSNISATPDDDGQFLYFYSDHAEYKKVSRSYPLIETLFSGYNNLVLEKKMITGPDDPSKRVDLDKVFFNHSLLAYLKTADLSESSEAYKYFILAMEHGLFLEGRFEKRFDEFYVFDKEKITAMKKVYKTLFDGLIQEFRSKK